MKKDNGEQQLNDWTKQLHDKLAGHETPAPAGLWADIEAALPSSGQRFQALQPRKAHFISLRRWAAAAAVAFILIGGGLVWWNQEGQQSERLTSMAEESGAEYVTEAEGINEAESITPDISGEPCVADRGNENEAPLQSELLGLAVRKSRTDSPNSSDSQSEQIGLTKRAVMTESLDYPVNPSGDTCVSPSGDARISPSGETHTKDLLPEQPVTIPRQRRIKRQPSLGLYAMNGIGSQNNSNAVMMADALAKSYTNTSAAGQAASRQAPIFLTGFEERQHHYQPLSFGLSVSYPLTGRLSLTSGIVYTKVRSDFTQVIRSQQYTKAQTLHYIGVPLGLNYRVWRYKGFRAYLAAGMQADWNVKAQLSAEGVAQEMSRDRLQWSANGSLGLQYDVLPQLSLYAEPGVNHYFDNGSTVQNFFKDKPTSLKLQVGIRLNL